MQRHARLHSLFLTSQQKKICLRADLRLSLQLVCHFIQNYMFLMQDYFVHLEQKQSKIECDAQLMVANHILKNPVA